MEWITIKAEPRTEKGSISCRHLRKKGLIPAIVYGRKEPEEFLTINLKDLVSALHKGARLINLAISDKTEMVLIKDVQFDRIKEKLIHMDFNRISLDEMLTMEIDITLKGHPKGVVAGGVLEQNLHRLTIQCLPTNIPSNIELDVSAMEIGELVRVKDLPLPEKVKAVTDAGIVVAGVHQPKVEEVAPPTEVSAIEPEVLTAKKEAPEEGAEGKEEKKPGAKEEKKPGAKEEKKPAAKEEKKPAKEVKK